MIWSHIYNKNMVLSSSIVLNANRINSRYYPQLHSAVNEDAPQFIVRWRGWPHSIRCRTVCTPYSWRRHLWWRWMKNCVPPIRDRASPMRPDPGGAACGHHHRRRDSAPDRSRQPPTRHALGREPRWQRHIARRSHDPAGGGSRDRPVAQSSGTATQKPLPPHSFSADSTPHTTETISTSPTTLHSKYLIAYR